MVDEKPIPFVPALAVPAQGGGHRLALFPELTKTRHFFPRCVQKIYPIPGSAFRGASSVFSSNTGSASGTTGPRQPERP